MFANKFYLVLVLLSIFVVCSLCGEQKSRKSNSTSDARPKKNENKNDDNRRRHKFIQDSDDDRRRGGDDDDEDDDTDDFLGSSSGYADNRYTSSSMLGSGGNYRTRPRWPAAQSSPSPSSSPLQLEDLLGGNEWQRFDLPNTFPSFLPSASHDSNSLSSSSSSCHSLIDPQYPIFSDICGAVPQARYSLPNTFGHRERWQVAQILSHLTSASTDSSCTRSLRLLLCPVLFPPCQTRHESAPVLPCQSYCRTVKARCAIPSLDILPCETLPHSSDLCPANQAFGSFGPSGGFPAVNQPSQLNNGFPSSNFPIPRALSSLQSLLSSQALQAGLQQSLLSSQSSQSGIPQSFLSQQSSQSGIPQSFLSQQSLLPQQSLQAGLQQSLLSPQPSQSGMSQSLLSQHSLQSVPQQSAQSAGSFNLFNGSPLGTTDTINNMFADFPSRLSNNDYRQALKYSSGQRSTAETRPVADAQISIGQRLSAVPSGIPSLVKA